MNYWSQVKNPPEQPNSVEISRLVETIFSLPGLPSVADTYSEIIANGTITLIRNNRLITSVKRIS